MNSKKWKQRAWLVAVAFILICVVNPELRALVFLIDVLSLEVFLLIAGLQLKGLWLVVRPAAGNLLASLTRSLGAAARHLGFATDALSPRVPMALLAQQTVWATRMALRARAWRM